jgi:hypothetical protein
MTVLVSRQWAGWSRLWWLIGEGEEPRFDQAKLAGAGGYRRQDEGGRASSGDLGDNFSDGDKRVVVGTDRASRCDLSGAGVCTEVIAPGAKPAEQTGGRVRTATDVSPDKTKAAFIRDWNLWVRDVATGKETQLTMDGVKDYGYATDNAGWTMSDNPILVWSPDSKEDCDLSAGPAQGLARCTWCR